MRYYFLSLIILLLTGCQTSFYKGAPSDHFDGKKFYYPGEKNRSTHRSVDLLNLLIAIIQNPWPRQLPSINYLTLPHYPKETKITFINHSTVLIQTRKVNFLLDPIYSYRASPFKLIGPARVREPGIKFPDLPMIDAVLISHNHYDHLDLATLKMLDRRFKPLFIVPLGNKVLLNAKGIKNVVELDWWQTINIKDAKVSFLPARHSAQRWLHDYNRSLWGSYGLQVDNKKIYFAGDSGYADHFKAIRKKWGRPDFSLLPIGAYEPRALLEHDHMNPEEAVKSKLDLGSYVAMGIHWNTFKLSSESIDQPVKDLEVALDKHGIPKDEFFVAPEGQPFYIKKFTS